MASFRCYDNFDVIATLIMTNFLIQLWWQFFQMFVYGDVVYAQTWQVLTLTNCIEALSYASIVRPMLRHRMALVSFRQFSKNLGKWFTPPPLAENCWKQTSAPNRFGEIYDPKIAWKWDWQLRWPEVIIFSRRFAPRWRGLAANHQHR